MTTYNTTWHLDGTTLTPDLTNEPAPPAGEYRSGAKWDTPTDPAPKAGDPVTVTLTYAPIPDPQPPLAPIVAPFDPGTMDLAIHTDTTLTDDDLGAFLDDPRGALLQPAMGVAVVTGDWSRVQRLYDSLKATPPSPCTATTIQTIGQHAVDAHATLTV